MTNRRDFLNRMAAGLAVAAWPLPDWTAASAAFGFLADPVEASRAAWAGLPQILARIVAPTFPAKDFDIRKYGAVGENRTDNTAAFQAAVKACSEAGGGRVVVPAGAFMTEPSICK